MNVSHFDCPGPLIYNPVTDKLYIFGESSSRVEYTFCSWACIQMNTNEFIQFKNKEGLGEFGRWGKAVGYNNCIAFISDGNIHIIGEPVFNRRFSDFCDHGLLAHWICDQDINEFRLMATIDSSMIGRYCYNARNTIFIPRKNEVVFLAHVKKVLLSLNTNECRCSEANVHRIVEYQNSILTNDENNIIIHATNEQGVNELLVVDIDYTVTNNAYIVRQKIIISEYIAKIRINIIWKSYRVETMQDDILISGYARQIFDKHSFQCKMLPECMCQLTVQFYCVDTLHIAQNRERPKYIQNHYCVPIQQILSLTSSISAD
ncbi:MAG: hypothetical protein GY928_26395 [Colwellia sp.]|nr:hypothetical protein [Colwellia sp.]